MKGNIKLYYHMTSGGAKYLFDTFIKCPNGHREGTINDKTKYIVRIDGDITKDAELTVKNIDISTVFLKKARKLIKLIDKWQTSPQHESYNVMDDVIDAKEALKAVL